MTNEEIEDVVLALTLIAENLETGPVKQSMQEAFNKVLAHARATRAAIKEVG